MDRNYDSPANLGAAALQVPASESGGADYALNAFNNPASTADLAEYQRLAAERHKQEEERHQAYEERERAREIQSRSDQIRGAALHAALTISAGRGDPTMVLEVAREMEAFLRGEADTPKSH